MAPFFEWKMLPLIFTNIKQSYDCFYKKDSFKMGQALYTA